MIDFESIGYIKRHQGILKDITNSCTTHCEMLNKHTYHVRRTTLVERIIQRTSYYMDYKYYNEYVSEITYNI